MLGSCGDARNVKTVGDHMMSTKQLARVAEFEKNRGESKSWSRLASVGKNYYEILELPRNATKSDIRAAFVDLSKKHHPDKNPDDPHTHDQFVRISRAYNTLIRPESRRRYDTSMAYRLHQQSVARSMARTHSYSGNMRPDNWTEDSESDSQNFQDEYIFNMRDKSKDAHYADMPYYGFKGLNKLSNAVIVWGCIGLLVLGAVTHVLVIGASSRHALNVRDENDKRLHAAYLASKNRARIHGTNLQLELLGDRAAKNMANDQKPK